MAKFNVQWSTFGHHARRQLEKQRNYFKDKKKLFWFLPVEMKFLKKSALLNGFWFAQFYWICYGRPVNDENNE